MAFCAIGSLQMLQTDLWYIFLDFDFLFIQSFLYLGHLLSAEGSCRLSKKTKNPFPLRLVWALSTGLSAQIFPLKSIILTTWNRELFLCCGQHGFAVFPGFGESSVKVVVRLAVVLPFAARRNPQNHWFAWKWLTTQHFLPRCARLQTFSRWLHPVSRALVVDAVMCLATWGQVKLFTCALPIMSAKETRKQMHIYNLLWPPADCGADRGEIAAFLFFPSVELKTFRINRIIKLQRNPKARLTLRTWMIIVAKCDTAAAQAAIFYVTDVMIVIRAVSSLSKRGCGRNCK